MKREYMTIDQWHAEGRRRFGDEMRKWRFVCPACGHVQAVEDFAAFKHLPGVFPESARFNCIGRYSGSKRRAFGGDGPGPCDYTSGGLFDIRPVTVVRLGEEIRSFAFADAPTPEAEMLARPLEGDDS